VSKSDAGDNGPIFFRGDSEGLIEPDLSQIARELWIISPLPALVRALDSAIQ